MRELDRVTAVKANLELLIMDNENLLERFKDVIRELEAIEELPKEQKYERFHKMEASGAFKLNGIDIRMFAKSAPQPLPPQEFLIRTRRRLENTATLISEFLRKGLFEQGKGLKDDLLELVGENVDATKGNAVVEFRNKVEALRDTERFRNYQTQKTSFLKEDPELKAEADILASKEAVSDGEQVARAKNGELHEIQSKLDLGELSAKDAQELIDQLDEPNT